MRSQGHSVKSRVTSGSGAKPDRPAVRSWTAARVGAEGNGPRGRATGPAAAARTSRPRTARARARRRGSHRRHPAGASSPARRVRETLLVARARRGTASAGSASATVPRARRRNRPRRTSTIRWPAATRAATSRGGPRRSGPRSRCTPGGPRLRLFRARAGRYAGGPTVPARIFKTPARRGRQAAGTTKGVGKCPQNSPRSSSTAPTRPTLAAFDAKALGLRSDLLRRRHRPARRPGRARLPARRRLPGPGLAGRRQARPPRPHASATSKALSRSSRRSAPPSRTSSPVAPSGSCSPTPKVTSSA